MLSYTILAISIFSLIVIVSIITEYYLLKKIIRNYFLFVDIETVLDIRRSPLFDMMISYGNPNARSIYSQFFRENFFGKIYIYRHFDIYVMNERLSSKEKYVARFTIWPVPSIPLKLEIKKKVDEDVIVLNCMDMYNTLGKKVN